MKRTFETKILTQTPNEGEVFLLTNLLAKNRFKKIHRVIGYRPGGMHLILDEDSNEYLIVWDEAQKGWAER